MSTYQVDCSFYGQLYDDLRFIEDLLLLKHWEEYGKNEGRLCSREYFKSIYPYFDCSEYRHNNKDLQKLNDDQLMLHYHHHGWSENRKCIKDMKIEGKPLVLLVLHIGSADDKINRLYLTLLSRMLKEHSSIFSIDIYITAEESKLASLELSRWNFHGSNSVQLIPVENLGADLYPFLHCMTSISNDYDLVVKLHTKTVAKWSIDLIRAVYDLEALYWLFKMNNRAGVIGTENWTIPIWTGLTPEYQAGIAKLNKDAFGFTLNERNSEYINFVTDQGLLDIDRYRDTQIDLHSYITLFGEESDYRNHANGMQLRNEYRVGAHNTNKCNLERFIAGTIFALRGSTFKQLCAEKDGLKLIMKRIVDANERGLVKDGDGTIYRNSHAAERIIQTHCYKYGLGVFGVKPCKMEFSDPLSPITITPKTTSQQPQVLLLTKDLDSSGLSEIVRQSCAKLSAKGYHICTLALADGNAKNVYETMGTVDILDVKYPLPASQLCQLIEMLYNVLDQQHVQLVIVNSICLADLVYGLYNGNRRIALVTEEGEIDIVRMYNSGNIIATNFAKYLDVIISSKATSCKKLSKMAEIDIPILCAATDATAKLLSLVEDRPQTYNSVKLDFRAAMKSSLYNSYPDLQRYISHIVSNWNLLAKANRSIQDGARAWYAEGIVDSRPLYRLPPVCKKTMLMVLHEGTHTGAPKVGCLLATHFQRDFNVVVLSMNGDDVLRSYVWEHPPIIIHARSFEHSLCKYLDRLDLARKIIRIVQPDVVYVNSIASHVYYHAAKDFGIPIVYNTYEGSDGFKGALNNWNFPYERCLTNTPSNALFYSCSPLGTICMKNMLGLNDLIPVKEFQVLDIEDIERRSKLVPCAKTEQIHNWKSKLKPGKSLFGMVGSRSHRKGFDIFVELARQVPDHLFVWVGAYSGCQAHVVFNDVPNLLVIDNLDNPYPAIALLDYLLLTSREDLTPLVITEAAIMGVSVVLTRPNISCWKWYDDLGCVTIDEETSVELWKKVVASAPSYRSTYNAAKLQEYAAPKIAEMIVNDISQVANGLLKGEVGKLYPHWKHGCTVYDHQSVKCAIDVFLQNFNNEWNATVYANKYQDIVAAGTTSPDDLHQHYLKIGFKRRNCRTADWGLYLSQHKHLLALGIDSAEKLTKMGIAYENYSIKWDWESYLALNPDLSAAGIATSADTFAHWKNHGVYEGRCCVSI
jgi:glycosyltransferase involved in cell wall biosynthesis